MEREKVFRYFKQKKTYSGGSHTSTLTHYNQKKEKKFFIFIEKKCYTFIFETNKIIILKLLVDA